MAYLTATMQFTRRWLEKEWELILRHAVIIGVLSSSLYLAPRIARGGHRYPAFLFLLFLVVVLAVLFMRWPVLGLILVILGASFIPYHGPGGFNIAQIGAAFLILIWVMDMLVRQKRISLIQSRMNRPVFFFLIISLLAFGMGQVPWHSFARNAPFNAQLGGLAVVVLSLGLFLVVANQVREMRWLQALTWVFIGLGGVYIFSRFFGLGFHDRLFNYGFAAGSSMFWTWLMALTFSQALFNIHLKAGLRALLVFLTIAMLYVGYVHSQDWKSGWLPPLVCVAAILTIRYWNKLRYLFILSVIPTWYIISHALETEEYSWGTRVDAWLIVVEITKVNPIFGMGFSNYYWYTPLIPIRGWNVVFNSHSQFVDVYAQMGILGLIGFLWIFWALIRLGLQLRNRAPEGFARAYVYGVLGGLAGTLFAASLVDWVLPFVYNIGMNGFRGSMLAWIFMGGLVSLEQIIKNQGECSQNQLNGVRLYE
jgi:hypothetical protein